MGSSKVHILVGLVVTALAVAFFYSFFSLTLVQIPVFALVVFLFSQLPDIDSKISNITWTFLGIGIFFLWAGYLYNHPVYFLGDFLLIDMTYFGLMIITLTFLCANLLPHRGPTHTIWFVLFAPFLLLTIPGTDFVSLELIIVAMIAIYTHLITDGLFFKLSLKPKYVPK